MAGFSVVATLDFDLSGTDILSAFVQTRPDEVDFVDAHPLRRLEANRFLQVGNEVLEDQPNG